MRSPMKRYGLSSLFYALSFLAPCGIVVASFFILSMYPFGDRAVSVWDLQITYTYFYEWFRDCLAGNQNIFYSFSKSLGGNMYAGWSGLLTSPINWLILLCGDNPMDFVTLMIVLKFGLAGLTSYFYVRRRFALSRPISLCLSVCYSMMLFMTTQSANPMWMEVVILLPLVMYGVYCIVHRGKVVFFYVSLLATIICNYYNGYMVCLFSIMFYLFESYLFVPQAKRVRAGIMVNPGRFSIAFSLAVFSSLFILLPTVLGLLGGKGAVPGGLFTFEFRYDLNDLARSFFLGVYEKEQLPQMYCGTLTLICAIWFFLSDKIGKREKVAAGVFIGFMVFSTWYAPFDRIWLGLRDGNSFYCRFTFLVSALFLFVAARALSVGWEHRSYKGLVKAAAIVGIVAVVIYCDGNFPRTRFFVATIAMCVAIPLVVILLDRFRDNAFRRSALSAILVLAVSFEALLSCHGIFRTRLDSDNPSYYSRYGSYYEEGENALEEVDAKDGTDVNAYRLEKTYNFLSPFRRIALNETMAFDYAGIALYDSAYDDRVQNVLSRLGYTPDRGIRTSYNDPMIVSDALLGIRYVSDDECPPGFVESDIESTWEGKRFYENPYALPLGYKASSEILDEIEFDGDPFEYQNELVNKLVGEEVDCIVDVRGRLVERGDDEWVWEIELPADAPEGAILYGYFEYGWQLSVDLYDNDEYLYVYLDDWSQGVFPITAETEDGVHSIMLKGDIPENADDLVFHAAYVDMDKFGAACDKLASHPFEIDTFKDGEVAGTYVSDGDGVLFTTIPYDAGWTIEVNGTVVEPQVVQDAFIAFDVEAGENTIKMTYFPPALGLTAGLSGLAVAGFIASAVAMRRRDRQLR